VFIRYVTPNGGQIHYESDNLEDFLTVVNAVAKTKCKVIESSVSVSVVRHSEHDVSQAMLWFNTKEEAKAFKLGIEMSSSFSKVEFI